MKVKKIRFFAVKKEKLFEEVKPMSSFLFGKKIDFYFILFRLDFFGSFFYL